MNTCSVEGCTDPYRCSGYCALHYSRVRLHGDPQPDIPRKMRADRPPCSVDECGLPHRSKGLCAVHYDRMRKHGSLELPVRGGGICSVEGCAGLVYSNGYCRPHDQRVRLTGDPRPDEPLRVLPRKADRGNVIQRIKDRSRVTAAGCLEWQGHLSRGYGSISVNARSTPVHIAMWVAVHGPLPEGDWTLDHLCYNRACSNVEHLEVVSRAENVMRAMLRKYAGTDNLPEPVLEFLRAASKGLLEGKQFFEPWITAVDAA